MIKRAKKEDAGTLAALAAKMRNEHDPEEPEREFAELTSSEDAACFLKLMNGKAVGFAQCQLRTDCVEGTESSPVGYLEGHLRRGGIPQRRFCKGAPDRVREVGEGEGLHGVRKRLRAR